MKIEHIKIVKKEDVKQPLYRYVKPTDYYLSILGETTPTEAAMINNVYTLEMRPVNIIHIIIQQMRFQILLLS
ncbi:hypothetical protein [Acidiplasma cupricumulans]|uniref:hypothetical protein n=1 Tax=Acidiplasma cupricumulans TaxID=312540 RepID=UPI000A626DF7|nr:hypothetical protein [Acidiplasma cupricumulans]